MIILHCGVTKHFFAVINGLNLNSHKICSDRNVGTVFSAWVYLVKCRLVDKYCYTG